MNLAEQLLEQIADPTLPHSKRARLRCQLAKALAELGDYKGAREAMGELWSRVGERPVLDGLDQWTAAEVLLRAGTLTNYIGGANQIEGAQETAKNLISESMTLFESLGMWRSGLRHRPTSLIATGDRARSVKRAHCWRRY